MMLAIHVRWPKCRCGHTRRWHGSVRRPGSCKWCACLGFVEAAE